MKQYFTFLICLFTLVSYSQDKAVHLVHGLGGTGESWEEFSNKLEDECDGLFTTTYHNTSNAGLAVYSSELLNDFSTNNEYDVAVGHSFGGIVLHNIENENRFGAYLTVGSVHAGSPLANAKISGAFDAWIENTCREVITEPFFAMEELFPIIHIPDFLEGIHQTIICNRIGNILNDKASIFIGEGQSVEDLKDGGIASNLPSASKPAISLVCSTEGHPLWELLDGAESFSLPLNMTYNGAAKTIEFGAKATSRLLSVISNITSNSTLSKKFKKASRECRDSFQWMQNTESAWNELIGAGGGITWSNVQGSSWNCDCYNVNTGEPVPCSTLGSSNDIIINDIGPDSTCDSDSDCWVTETFTIPSFGADLPSDGLIPVHRQYLDGSIFDETINNVTHFGEPEDGGVQKAIMKHIHPSTTLNNAFKISNCL